MEYSKLLTINLKNFQSWKNLTLKFSEGLNVLIAPNDTGKSVFYKAIELTCVPEKFNKDDRNDFLRDKSTEGLMTYVFNSGIIYVVKFDEKQNYYFRSTIEDSSNLTYMGQWCPRELLDCLSIILQGTNIGNLLDFKKDLFLVDSDGSYNHQALSSIFINEDLDKIINKIKYSLLPNAKELYNEAKAQNNLIIGALKEYKEIDEKSLESVIKYSEELLTGIEKLDKFSNDLDALPKVHQVPNRTKELLKDSVCLDNLYNELSTLKRPSNYVNKEILDTCIMTDNLYSVLSKSSKMKACEFSKIINNYYPIYSCLTKHPKPIDKTIIEVLENLEKILPILDLQNSILSLEEDIDYLQTEIDSLGGEVHDDCPIYGRIRFVGGECLRCD